MSTILIILLVFGGFCIGLIAMAMLSIAKTSSIREALEWDERIIRRIVKWFGDNRGTFIAMSDLKDILDEWSDGRE